MIKAFWSVRIPSVFALGLGMSITLGCQPASNSSPRPAVWTSDGTELPRSNGLDPAKVLKGPAFRHPGRRVQLSGRVAVLGTKIREVRFLDDRRVASAGIDGSVRVWDVQTRQLAQVFCFDGEVTSFALSRDRRYIAVGVETGAQCVLVYLWDLAQPGLMRRIQVPVDDRATSIAFSPNGEQIAVGGSRGLWVLERTTHKMLFKCDQREATDSVAFSPDGKLLAAGGGELLGNAPFEHKPMLRLWNWESGSLVTSFIGHTENVSSVVFSLDGRTLISGAEDGTVRLWEVATGKGQRVLGKPKSYHAAWALSLAPDGKTLAVARSSRELSTWDLSTFQELRKRAVPDDPLRPGDLLASDALHSVGFSPNGRLIVTGGSVGIVRIWDAATLEQLGTENKEGS